MGRPLAIALTTVTAASAVLCSTLGAAAAASTPAAVAQGRPSGVVAHQRLLASELAAVRTAALRATGSRATAVALPRAALSGGNTYVGLQISRTGESVVRLTTDGHARLTGRTVLVKATMTAHNEVSYEPASSRAGLTLLTRMSTSLDAPADPNDDGAMPAEDVVLIDRAGKVHAVTHDGLAEAGDITPDGKHVIYTKFDAEGASVGLVLANLDGTHPRTIYREHDEWAMLSPAALSPDGRTVYTIRNNDTTTLLAIDLATGRVRAHGIRLRGAGEAYGAALEVAPNGRVMAVEAMLINMAAKNDAEMLQMNVQLAAVSGGVAGRVFPIAMPGLTFSPLGSRLVLAHPDGLHSVAISGTADSPILGTAGVLMAVRAR